MQWGLPWYTCAMKPPLFMRPLANDERRQLDADRRAADAFRVRRAQIVLASAQGLSPKPIAQLVECSVQTVRNVLRAFHTRGMEGLEKQSNGPKTVTPPSLRPSHVMGCYGLTHSSLRFQPSGGAVLLPRGGRVHQRDSRAGGDHHGPLRNGRALHGVDRGGDPSAQTGQAIYLPL